MKKTLLLYLFLIIVILGFTGCNKLDTLQKEPKIIKFSYQDGTPALTAAKLAKENPIIDENITIEYEMEKSPDLLVTKILKGEADIAIVPSNLAAQAFNKELPYKIVGTSVWGSLYLASTEDIKDFEELKDKEIYTFGKGLTPDIVLRYVLSKNGIVPDKNVKITYLNAASEVGPIFISGKSNLAVLAEPLLTTVTMKKQDTKVIFDLNQEWANATGVTKGYPQASLIIKEDLIKNNIEFVKEFIDIYEESRKWAKENGEELGKYAEELGISVAKETIEKGIIWTNIESFDIRDGKEEYNAYYGAILDFAPDFIGGKMPDEKIYFER
ncbi:ABC transporter substrate-binding protein [Tissierella carlieri]|uniref:ABC transporter substrate-binding protein n=1 Tax=Tissierella carlieri TaxID=689904 RepID=A0ABT1SGD2_9FIRM|nr:MqnA/MqnD/SBP family protein [Tissierella carlieri]MBU5311842.1 ABC transporter substrate-binding protein [Tissierella carlieri]MCQ4925335.1 ABC transporter substrate-binding protein [Tissierella carlieri]MDU5082115.1 MqnA/MqnD/SBP family protein [Bacillota bacterium]